MRNLKTSFASCFLLLFMGLGSQRISQAVEKETMDRLLELSRTSGNLARFADELRRVLGEEKIRKGTAWAGHGPNFVWAIQTTSAPVLYVNDSRFADMRRAGDTDMWFHTGVLPVGDAHKFHYLINGEPFGGDVNVPAYTPDSYAQPGVPQGKLSEKMTHVSKIYKGMETNYWVYTPA